MRKELGQELREICHMLHHEHRELLQHEIVTRLVQLVELALREGLYPQLLQKDTDWLTTFLERRKF